MTGGPNSCYEEDSPTYIKELFEMGIPVLGLLLWCSVDDAYVWWNSGESTVREYGKTDVIM